MSGELAQLGRRALHRGKCFACNQAAILEGRVVVRLLLSRSRFGRIEGAWTRRYVSPCAASKHAPKSALGILELQLCLVRCLRHWKWRERIAHLVLAVGGLLWWPSHRTSTHQCGEQHG